MLKAVKSQAFAAITILGTTLTLLGNIDALVTFSGLAKNVVEGWRDLTSVVWLYLFAYVNITPGPITCGFLTLVAFVTGLAASALSRNPSNSLVGAHGLIPSIVIIGLIVADPAAKVADNFGVLPTDGPTARFGLIDQLIGTLLASGLALLIMGGFHMLNERGILIDGGMAVRRIWFVFIFLGILASIGYSYPYLVEGQNLIGSYALPL